MKKMLANNAEKLVDPDLYRKYDLELTVKGNNVYDHGEKMATVLAISTFANDKGVAIFDKDFIYKDNKWTGMEYHICLDEFQKEKTQREQGDICYQFVNQLENVVRFIKNHVKIFLIGNTLEEASDIMTMFNFVPEEFGRYKLCHYKKILLQFLKEYDEDMQKAEEKYKDYIKKFGMRCVIDYLPPTEKYINKRAGTVGDILAGNTSNFTNKIETDTSLITKQRLIKPTAIIHFSKNSEENFTVWDGNIIAPYNGEKCKTHISMRPWLDLLFNVQTRDQIIELYDTRSFLFRNLMTVKKFQKQLQQIKPRKA